MFVFSNLAISLDGKIACASREFHMLGTDEDRRQMQVLRRKSDAILFGATTLRTFKRACFVKGSEKPILNIIVSRNLEGIDPSFPFFSDQRIERLFLITGEPNPSLLSEIKKTSKVEKVSQPTLAQDAIRIAEQLGVRNLLVEGGGGVMWDFAKDNLIDEYNVTLTPRIVGGSTAPTLVDGEGFTPKDLLNLKLKESRVVGDEIYLVYSKTEIRG